MDFVPVCTKTCGDLFINLRAVTQLGVTNSPSDRGFIINYCKLKLVIYPDNASAVVLTLSFIVSFFLSSGWKLRPWFLGRWWMAKEERWWYRPRWFQGIKRIQNQRVLRVLFPSKGEKAQVDKDWRQQLECYKENAPKSIAWIILFLLCLWFS